VTEFLMELKALPVTADLFLWVFLPLLLFETALTVDSRALLDDLAPVLVLAVVAVVLCTLGAGTALFAVSNESLAACLLLASIIATTDPVAVIAIFREVGAPRRLSLLVEGESLLNDAAAIALFSALLAAVVGKASIDVTTIGMQFLVEFVGGAVVGAVAGRLAGLAIGRLDQGGPAEITISVALAYLTYAMADAYFHVSGVVAVVVGGLVFGAVGRTRLASHEWSALTAIWSQLGFWGSSLIFVLASMLVPKTLENVTAMDLLGVAALIVGALGARAATLYGVLPFVTGGRRGNAVDGRYKLVILWGGLRGAVTLALALALSETRGVSPVVQHWVSVLATSFVLFTLLIQATTLRPLLRWLRLDELSAAERILRQRALALTHAEIRDRLSAAAIAHGLDLEAAFSTPHFPVEPMPEEDDPSEGMQREHLVSALLTISTRESELYVQEIAERMISRGAGGALLRRSAGLVDALKQDGLQGYRRAARDQRWRARWTSVAAFLHRRLAIERPLALHIAHRVEQLLVQRRVLEELLSFTGRRIAVLFGPRVADTSKLILETRLNDVERGLDAVRLQYPAYWGQVSAQYLARVAAQLERDGYNRLREERLLSAELFRSLDDEIRHRRQQLERAPPLDLGLEIGALIRRVPVFQGLTEPELASVARLLRPRLALPNERIVRRGEVGNAMYFIASGAVEVALGQARVRLGTGDFFGEMALILRRPRGADVIALGYCSLVELRRDAFRTFLKLRPELMREVRRVAEARLSGELPGGTAAPEREVQP
jgi:CPA1 family monovalent cation:H+ antiporter